MSVIRVKKASRKPYVIVDITALNDARLSFRAKGLHTYLMSKPDDWQVYIEQLEKESPKEGRDAIRAALKELEDCGYIKRSKKRGEKGRMAGWETAIYETPALAQEDASADAERIGFTDPAPTSAQPTSAQPTSAQPTSANPQLLNIDLNQDLKEVNLEKEEPPIAPQRGRPLPSRTLDTNYSPGFLQAWGLYPGTRRVSKPLCFQRWQQARLEARTDEICSRIQTWSNGPWRTLEQRFIPLFSTWLNQGRYEDDAPLDANAQLAAEMAAEGWTTDDIRPDAPAWERARPVSAGVHGSPTLSRPQTTLLPGPQRRVF